MTLDANDTQAASVSEQTVTDLLAGIDWGATDRLAQIVDLGMLAAPLPDMATEISEGVWPIEHTVQLARHMEKQLQQVDDNEKMWQNQQLHERISEPQNALSRWGHEASAEQNDDVWSLQERRAVGTFIKKQIDDVPMAEESSALQEMTARALDYRYWYRFVVERLQDGVWHPTYGRGSGGKRVHSTRAGLGAAIGNTDNQGTMTHGA